MKEKEKKVTGQEKKTKEQELKEKKSKEKEQSKTDSKFEKKQEPQENLSEEFAWESEEGQEILKTQNKGRKQEEAEEVPHKREEISLEEAVAEERVARQQQSFPLEQNKYVLQLSEKPIRSLQEEMGHIYRIVEDRGYITKEEERRVEYLSSAVERKLEAIEEGKYSLTEDVARAALLTQSISDTLRNTYRRNKKENDWYRSG